MAHLHTTPEAAPPPGRHGWPCWLPACRFRRPIRCSPECPVRIGPDQSDRWPPESIARPRQASAQTDAADDGDRPNDRRDYRSQPEADQMGGTADGDEDPGETGQGCGTDHGNAE